MSELTRFRDYARRMSTADHKPDCRKPETDTHGWKGKHPDPACGGCNPEADRALFAQLAAEVDTYLTHDAAPTFTAPQTAVDLFGGETAEPRVSVYEVTPWTLDTPDENPWADATPD